jgi:hypothetical protein
MPDASLSGETEMNERPEPRTIGEEAARKWLQNGAATAINSNEERLWLEAEKRLAKVIDEVVSDWVERGG